MNNDSIIRKFFLWIAIVFVLELTWVGAEFLFEGVVHSSQVDAIYCCLLARYMVREAYRHE